MPVELCPWFDTTVVLAPCCRDGSAENHSSEWNALLSTFLYSVAPLTTWTGVSKRSTVLLKNVGVGQNWASFLPPSVAQQMCIGVEACSSSHSKWINSNKHNSTFLCVIRSQSVWSCHPLTHYISGVSTISLQWSTVEIRYQIGFLCRASW